MLRLQSQTPRRQRGCAVGWGCAAAWRCTRLPGAPPCPAVCSKPVIPLCLVCAKAGCGFIANKPCAVHAQGMPGRHRRIRLQELRRSRHCQARRMQRCSRALYTDSARHRWVRSSDCLASISAWAASLPRPATTSRGAAGDAHERCMLRPRSCSTDALCIISSYAAGGKEDAAGAREAERSSTDSDAASVLQGHAALQAALEARLAHLQVLKADCLAALGEAVNLASLWPPKIL